MRVDPPPPDASHRRGIAVPIADCLRGTSIAAHGMHLAEVNRRLRQLRPDLVDAGMQLADIHDGHATFLAYSSARAARLRHNQRALRDLLLAVDERVDAITVKVVQPRHVPHAPAHREPLSAAVAAQLRATATSIEDPDLAAGFLRLASLAE